MDADAVVIGAGIFGASIAFQLVKRNAGRVVLIDRSGPAAGSSGRSFGQVRRHYSNELTIRLANRGFEVIASWDEEVGVGDPGYRPIGYLLLVPESAVEACRGNVELGRRCGVDTAFVTPAEIARIEPLVSLGGVAGGAYEPDGGVVDVPAMIRSWLDAAAERGLMSVFGEAVRAIDVEGGRVVGVRTARQRLRAPIVVNAAGAWGPDLLRPLGVEVPISYYRVQMATLRQAEGRPRLRVSVTDTAGNLVMRPDRGPRALAVAYGTDLVQEPGPDVEGGVTPDYEARVRSAVAERVPEYRDAAWEGGVSGVYDATPDWHPVIGWAPGLEGLYLALGWSGHGLKLSPAVGEIVADEVLGRRPAIDVSALGLDRFTEGRLMRLAYGPGARA